jgi:hypothetical protein
VALTESIGKNWDAYAGRVGPAGDRSPWENPAHATDEVFHGRRIAQFMIESPGEDDPGWGSSLVEVQALVAPDEGIIFVSANSKRANKALQKAFPTVDELRDRIWNTLVRHIEAPFPELVVPAGQSWRINEDTIARRTVKLLKLLSEKRWQLLVVPNPKNVHAEVAIEDYQKARYPTMKRTGPATGTRPPCLGCLIYMSRPEVDALKYYLMVESPIQAGEYFLKATSGARALHLWHRIPVTTPDELTPADYARLLNCTVDDITAIKDHVNVVWVANDMRRIPESPGNVTTPDINNALNRPRSTSAHSHSRSTPKRQPR